LAQIAAALGRQFSHELISAVATMPKQQLGDALAQLVRAELIFRRGEPPDAEYTFKHALVQDAAYGTLLRSRRQQLHARIAATLEDHFPDSVLAQPELLARHCAEAGFIVKAVGYRLKAGQQAMTRSAMTEAVAQLQKGLDLVANLPETPWRAQQELDLQIALARALRATRGYSAPAVGETLIRARALAKQLDRPDYLGQLIWDECLFRWFRSEQRLALTLAEHMEKIGKARNDVRMQWAGHFANGVVRCYLGEFVAARALLEQCQGLADAADRVAASGWDPIGVRAYLAVTLAYLGYIDQARLRLNEALSEARRLKNANTLAEMLGMAIWVDWMTYSPEIQWRAEELRAVSTEHGLPVFWGWATVTQGRSLTTRGQALEGLRLITRGLEAIRATGTVVNTPTILVYLAEACAKLRRLKEGLKYLTEAARIIETSEERCQQAELHRVQGDLLDAIGDRAAAEQSYCQALAIAARQSAKVFELGAATSLARLWRDQGKRAEAHDLLAPVYSWFTEGFDTPVLQDAKALLDQLT
jgi:tetratricopeptide (TPR) repeat protein